jgi:Phosphomannose isomerase type I
METVSSFLFPAMQRILPQTQQYAWGKLGSSSKVAQLAISDDSFKVDESKPYVPSPNIG